MSTPSPREADAQPQRTRGQHARLLLRGGALVLAAACVAVGAQAAAKFQERRADEAVAERYAQVQRAATTEATALINISHTNTDAAVAAVLAGATGSFKDEFTTGSKDLAKLLSSVESVSTGKVVWAGVVSADQDSANVIVATTGDVRSTNTGGEAVPRNYRWQFDMVREGDAWLVSKMTEVVL